MVKGESVRVMKEVQVYSTDYCGFCTAAKDLLEQRDIEYVEINVQGDAEKRVWLLETTGQRTVPQIFIGGNPIGGFRELSALDREGKLMELVEFSDE